MSIKKTLGTLLLLGMVPAGITAGVLVSPSVREEPTDPVFRENVEGRLDEVETLASRYNVYAYLARAKGKDPGIRKDLGPEITRIYRHETATFDAFHTAARELAYDLSTSQETTASVYGDAAARLNKIYLNQEFPSAVESLGMATRGGGYPEGSVERCIAQTSEGEFGVGHDKVQTVATVGECIADAQDARAMGAVTFSAFVIGVMTLSGVLLTKQGMREENAKERQPLSHPNPKPA